MKDKAFAADRAGLEQALEALLNPVSADATALPSALPDAGLGEIETLKLLAPHVIGGAQRLGDETAFAHMDPPTPWITWATSLWNASLNQNLLHPELAPVAKEIEKTVIDWLAPSFAMTGGHMTPGSTISNLTALWAARELHGIRRVVASTAAHLSVAKSAQILGLDYEAIEIGEDGQIDETCLADDLSGAALVLTAGTTSAGAIDSLRLRNKADWLHVDAAWAGPLRLSEKHRHVLDGIDAADSVAVSAHKWLFQPKESGLILFRDVERAHAAVSSGSGYLKSPNVGLLGSHGASGVNLFATLIAWGRNGLAERIDKTMALSLELSVYLAGRDDVRLYAPNVSGVVLWQADMAATDIVKRLPPGSASTATVAESEWVRHVAANPDVDISALIRAIAGVLD